MSELAPLIEDGQSVSVQVREHKTNPLPDDVPDAPPSRSRTGTIPMIDAMDPDESGVETLEEVEAEASPPSFDQAPTVAPPEPTMDEILELAETLAREGQFERAREVLLAELHRKPAHPIILAHLDELRQQRPCA